MALQPRVIHLGDTRVAFQPAGHRQRGFFMRLHADRQGGGAPRDQPGVEGAHDAAVMDDRLGDQRADQLGRAADQPADRVAVAADILGRRMHHVVGAERQGFRADRAGKRAVDREAGASLVGDLRRRFDVGQPQERIAGRIDEDQLGLVRGRPGQCIEVRCVDLADLDAHAGQGVVGELGNACVGDVREDEMVAGRELGEQDRARRRHAGGEGDAGLGALKDRDLLFQLADGRVGPAGVDEGALLGQLVGREALGLFRHEGRGHDDVRARGPGRRVGRLAGMDRQRPGPRQ